METFNLWSSPKGYAMFMFLWMINKGCACEPPSSPLCFRENSLDDNIYKCEWNQTGNQSDVTYDLHFSAPSELVINTKKTWISLRAEQLIKERPVDVWVEAHLGTSNCTSPKTSAVLKQTVRFEAPHNITLSWGPDSLALKWPAAEKFPALAEIWFRRKEDVAETWEKKTANAIVVDASMYLVTIENLLKTSSHQVQIRHRCTQVKNSLWSNWSPVVTVPAELQHTPELKWREKLENGTRKVTLSWKPVPPAAAVGGVNFTLSDTQSLHGCPCDKKQAHTTTSTSYNIYLSYSAVNITLIAKNAAGESPPASVQIPAVHLEDCGVCNNSILNEKVKRRICFERYELDEDSKPTNGTFETKMHKKSKSSHKQTYLDHVRYLHFEQRCHGGKPQTVKMCFFYREEGAPNKEPPGFRPFSETHTSVDLSWKTIPLVNLRGFLTHYRLCVVKINAQDEPPACYNISASEKNLRLENLTPGTKYSISLAGVTKVGKGPEATVTVNTKPEKPLNLWLSFGLLIIFFMLSIMCTFVLKRIKSRIFPPVPRPFIPNFISHQTETQEPSEHKEEVHELMLLQLRPEHRTVLEETEEVTVFGGQWDDGSGEDAEEEDDGDRGDSGGLDDGSLSVGSVSDPLTTITEGGVLEQMDVELEKLIYRNGLVLTDSS
ncbi:unnamed protein product [Ophioblennius macclurei]